MQVLRECSGWGDSPYEWATAGYMGAIKQGQTICGTLFGATVFLGQLAGKGACQMPEVQDSTRARAIESVESLFRGFIERFGATDCRTLTGCNWRSEEDVNRFSKEEGYKGTCFTFFEYVLNQCLNQQGSAGLSGVSQGQQS